MSVGLVVHLDIEPEYFNELVEIVKKHGEFSVQNEPGCLSFTVLHSQEAENRLILVETYADEAALQAHWNSDHMHTYRGRTGHMIRDRERHMATVL
jgi:quinol monooxygenase YgiN